MNGTKSIVVHFMTALVVPLRMPFSSEIQYGPDRYLPMPFLLTPPYLVFRLTFFSRVTHSAGVATLHALNTFHSTAENPPTSYIDEYKIQWFDSF